MLTILLVGLVVVLMGFGALWIVTSERRERDEMVRHLRELDASAERLKRQGRS